MLRRFSGNRMDDLADAIAKEEQKARISRVYYVCEIAVSYVIVTDWPVS